MNWFALSTWEQFRIKVIEHFTNPNVWLNIAGIVFQILLILILGRLVSRVAHKMLGHMFVESEKHPLRLDQRRTRTIGKLIQNMVTYTVNFIVLLLLLNQIGLNLAPVLAGAGVLGLAIGFGAQSLVKDVITGFFIIFEDQFGVGDVVQIGTYKGTVEEIGLRITRLRSWTGEVHIIPNGTIAQVTNFSIHNALAVVDVTLTQERDVEKAISVLEEELPKLAEENEYLIKAPEVLGVQTLSATEVVIRVTAECKPNTNVALSRQLNLKIKTLLDKQGISHNNQES